MSKDKERITYKQVTNTVDTETGEVKRTEEITNIVNGKEPSFIKLYINTLLAFKDLPKTLNPLLLELLNYMGYADPTANNGGQLIIINAYIKQQIIKKLDMKKNTIEKSLTSLTKSGILKRVGMGTYQVNPNMFGKGDWNDIKAIRATFDFNSGEVQAELTSEKIESEDENE